MCVCVHIYFGDPPVVVVLRILLLPKIGSFIGGGMSCNRENVDLHPRGWPRLAIEPPMDHPSICR